MHLAALDILYFLDGLQERRRRQDMVLSAAVSAGIVPPALAWPEMFPARKDGGEEAFPSTDADMSEFRLEEATPESFMHDLALLESLAANQRLALREEEPPPFPRIPGLPDPEWTLPESYRLPRGVKPSSAPMRRHGR